MVILAQGLALRDDVQLAVVTATCATSSLAEYQHGGIQYYALPETKLKRKLRVLGLAKPDSLAEECLNPIRRFAPDVVVIHGTEYA